MEDEIDDLLREDRFVELGDLIQDVFTQPYQETSPCEQAQLLARKMDAILRKRFSLPSEYAPRILYRERHLAPEQRGSWQQDICHTMRIISIVVGGSTQLLHQRQPQLVDFYQVQATEQELHLREVSAQLGPSFSDLALEALRECQACLETEVAISADVVAFLNEQESEELSDDDAVIKKHHQSRIDRLTANLDLVHAALSIHEKSNNGK